MGRILSAFLLAIISVTGVLAQSVSAPQALSSGAISKILAERISSKHQSVGIVVGVIDDTGRRIISYGSAGSDNNRPLGGDTVFEIGSITKVFTSLLLADMVQRGEVALTDPVLKYLPAGVKVPERGGRVITLQDLASHTSGLPRLPDNMMQNDPANPYADYSAPQLFQFLASYKLPRDIGSEYEYSNVGSGLLGYALARRAGMDYEALVRTRITGPLAMKSTAITLPSGVALRLAHGHDAALNPVSNWDFSSLAGAGGLRSDADDMLTFLAVALGYIKSPLSPALDDMLKIRHRTPNSTTEIALGWHITTLNGKAIVWHNGGTGGYRSFVGYDMRSRTGVIVLSNLNTEGGVDDLGMHILNAQVPLRGTVHHEVAVDSKLYDGYVGVYRFAPNVILSITRTGNDLFAQLTGQRNLQIFPEGPHDYFYKAVDAQITFETDEKGRCLALVLHQNGRDMRAPRFD